MDNEGEKKTPKTGKRKLIDFDGILSNEDFQRIKELKAKKEANVTLIKKIIPTSDQLSAKRVDPAMFEVNVKKRSTKEEKLAMVRAGREDRGKYQARAAVKQKKTGGTSNKQKEHEKIEPMAAKIAKIVKLKSKKKKEKRREGKQFRGKKAWKS